MIRYFRFHEEGQDRSHYLELLGPDFLLDLTSYKFQDLYEEKIYPELERRDLEGKYGVHDVSFANNTSTLWGYSTYEVEDWENLMQEWREIWILAGFHVGNYFVREPEEPGRQL
jgi:hypothetical protein